MALRLHLVSQATSRMPQTRFIPRAHKNIIEAGIPVVRQLHTVNRTSRSATVSLLSSPVEVYLRYQLHTPEYRPDCGQDVGHKWNVLLRRHLECVRNVLQRGLGVATSPRTGSNWTSVEGRTKSTLF